MVEYLFKINDKLNEFGKQKTEEDIVKVVDEGLFDSHFLEFIKTSNLKLFSKKKRNNLVLISQM